MNSEIEKLLAEAQEVNRKKNEVNDEIQSYKGTSPEEKDLTPVIREFLDLVNKESELLNRIQSLGQKTHPA